MRNVFLLLCLHKTVIMHNRKQHKTKEEEHEEHEERRRTTTAIAECTENDYNMATYLVLPAATIWIGWLISVIVKF